MARSNASEDGDSGLVIDRLRAEVAELQRSRRRLVEAESADRRALERALHDGLQQRLVALAADIQYLARQLDQDPASAKGLVDAVTDSLRESLAEATALAEQLYPSLLDGRGLATSLRSVAAVAGLTLVVEVPPAADYPREITAAIYRSCVETLASASPGSLVGIGVGDADGGVTFEVAVEGRPSAALVERLRDRIEALDGRLTVDQEDGTSRVQGWLPLSR